MQHVYYDKFLFLEYNIHFIFLLLFLFATYIVIILVEKRFKVKNFLFHFFTSVKKLNLCYHYINCIWFLSLTYTFVPTVYRGKLHYMLYIYTELVHRKLTERKHYTTQKFYLEEKTRSFFLLYFKTIKISIALQLNE